MNKDEWIGGKQIYPPQNDDDGENDDWWSLINPKDFGIGVSGFKSKKDSNKEKDNDNI